MVRGTTPTLTFKLGSECEFDLSQATSIYISIEQGEKKIMKTGEDITRHENNTVSTTLTQKDTLSLCVGKAEVQLNWTYRDADDNLKRAASKVKTINVEKQLLGLVIV